MDKNIITINSSERSSGIPENFNVNLQHVLAKGKTIKLLQISIPNTMFNINSPNNYIDILEYENNYSFSLFIPDGYYTIDKLTITMEDLLNKKSSLGPNKYKYKCMYSPTNHKLSISSTSDFKILFGSGPNYDKSLYQVLGFTQNDTPFSSIIVGDNIINISLPDVYVRIKEFINNKYLLNGSPYSFVVPNVAKYGEKIINTIPICQEITLSESRRFNQLDIILTDHMGKQLNLNGSEYMMELSFEE